jgi:hypothetical protein
MPRLSTPAEIAALRKEVLLERRAKPVWVTVCTGTGCCAYGAEGTGRQFREGNRRSRRWELGWSAAHGLSRFLRARAAGRSPTEGSLLSGRQGKRCTGSLWTKLCWATP